MTSLEMANEQEKQKALLTQFVEKLIQPYYNVHQRFWKLQNQIEPRKLRNQKKPGLKPRCNNQT